MTCRAQCVAIVSPPQCSRIPCSMCVPCEVRQMANSCGHPAIGHDKDRVTQSKHFRCCLPWLDVVAVLAPVRVGCFLVGDEVLQRRRALSERQGARVCVCVCVCVCFLVLSQLVSQLVLHLSSCSEGLPLHRLE